MKRLRFNHIIIIALAALSVVMFFLQQLFFHDLHESGFLFFQDLIFLPIHILLVTFLLDRILHAREKRERLEQMNILIGAFFSEHGTHALKILGSHLKNLDKIAAKLDMSAKWTDNNFAGAANDIKTNTIEIDIQTDLLYDLKTELSLMKPYLLQMFDNAGLLEHETFTDMLWSVYHLIDELESRKSFSDLPETDIIHLAGDIERAYETIVYEWIFYMKHLKSRYPYLWSLAVRKNPFVDHSITIH